MGGKKKPGSDEGRKKGNIRARGKGIMKPLTPRKCFDCNGTGLVDDKVCPACGGTGEKP